MDWRANWPDTVLIDDVDDVVGSETGRDNEHEEEPGKSVAWWQWSDEKTPLSFTPFVFVFVFVVDRLITKER